MPFTHKNLKDDVEDVGSNFDGAPDLEFHLATGALELAHSGLCLQRVPPGYRFPYGHTHETQEEVYVVVGGSGRMKLDDEIVELRTVGCGAGPAGNVAGLRSRVGGARASRHRRPQSRRCSTRRRRGPARLVGRLARLRSFPISRATEPGTRSSAQPRLWRRAARSTTSENAERAARGRPVPCEPGSSMRSGVRPARAGAGVPGSRCSGCAAPHRSRGSRSRSR